MSDFNVIVPIVKAGKDSAGRTWIHGVASDETLDLQQEVTLASGLTSGLPYLRRFGKFNDDHKPVDIGEVMAANVVTKGELITQGVLSAGLVPTADRGDEVLYVAGPLYDKLPRARYYRKVLDSGGRLGLSIQGAILDKGVEKSAGGTSVAVNKKCFINKIAVTDQPVNPNTWVSLKKSLSGSRAGKRGVRILMKSICKALETGQAIVAEGDTGGPALRKQSLEGAGRKRRRRKKGVMNMEHEFTCDAQSIEKSFGGLSAEDVQGLIRRALAPALVEGGPVVTESFGWVRSLFDDYAIVKKGGKSFRYPFKIKSGELNLGEPTEVIHRDVWEPVAAKKSLDLGPLDTPARIAKAWGALCDPAFVAEAEAEELRLAKGSVREAAKGRGLAYGIATDRDSNGSSVLCKSLAEGDLRTLSFLESASDEEFSALVDTDVAALEKSRAAKAPPAEEKPAEPAKKPEPKAEEGDEEEETDLDEMDLKQLVAYAKKNKIDLSGLDEDDMKDEDAIRDAIDDAEEGDEEPEKGEEEEAGKEGKKSLADLLSEAGKEGNEMDAMPIIKSLADSLSAMSEEIGQMPVKVAETLAEGIGAGIAKALEPVFEKIGALEKSGAAMREEVEQIGQTPLRPAGYRVLEKGGNGMSSARAKEVLCTAATEGMIPITDVTVYELNPAGADQGLIKSLEDKLVAKGVLSK